MIRNICAVAAITAAMASTAAASTVGFSLKISTAGALSGTFDAPGFTLTNLSDPGLTISSIDFTIGAPTYNFDAVTSIAAPAGGSMVLSAGHAFDGGGRTDNFTFGFTGFDAAELATWRAELDPDSTNGAVDFRSIFFNNGGGIANSIATVMFSDFRSLELTLAGATDQSNYTFFVSQESLAAVPVPATAPLLAGALALIGLTRGRRRHSNKA